jgi:phosphatidylinositol alpha-1,6-mannosyltransferase
MRVLLLAGSYPPETGGISQFMHSFSVGLRAKGVDVEVIANPKLPARGYIRRTEACRLEVVQRFRQRPFDRVVASSWSPYAVRLPEPFDVFCHGMDLLEPATSLRYRLIMKRTLYHASRVLANSHYTAGLAGKFGAQPGRVVILHPGVDCQQFRPAVSRVRRGERIILSVGRLIERKGFDTIVRALPEVLAQFPDVQYWCAGDGPDRDRLHGIARELKVDEHIRWLGQVDEVEKLRLFQHASVFAMPNRVTEADRSVEGFGIVFLEAAACGLPVIAGNSGGVADAVVDGETGYIVDASDPKDLGRRIMALLEDARLSREMGECGRARVQQQFRQDQIAERYLACL